MALDPSDQELIFDLSRRVNRLENIIHALVAILKPKTGITDQELREAVSVVIQAKQIIRERQGRSTEDTLLRFLQDFEGPEQ